MKARLTFVLDEQQAKFVQPIFDEVRNAAQSGKPGVVLCQLQRMRDGSIIASAGFVGNDIATKLVALMQAEAEVKA